MNICGGDYSPCFLSNPVVESSYCASVEPVNDGWTLNGPCTFKGCQTGTVRPQEKSCIGARSQQTRRGCAGCCCLRYTTSARMLTRPYLFRIDQSSMFNTNVRDPLYGSQNSITAVPLGKSQLDLGRAQTGQTYYSPETRKGPPLEILRKGNKLERNDRIENDAGFQYCLVLVRVGCVIAILRDVGQAKGRGLELET